jgi:hypothetical protein
MKNMNQNPAETPVTQIRAATGKIGGLRKQMPFLLPLTDAEREQHKRTRVGLGSLRTLENRLALAREQRGLLPASFDLAAFEADASTTSALAECEKALDQLRAEVHDTLLAVGKRAILAGASAYGHIQLAANTGERLKRTVVRLPTRAARGEAKNAAAAPEPEPKPIPAAVTPNTGATSTSSSPPDSAAKADKPTDSAPTPKAA